MNRERILPLMAGLALACIAACGHGMAAPTGIGGPARLPTPDRIPGDITVRQMVVGEHAGSTYSQEMVLQKRGDTLTVIGLAPFGKLWTVVQRGNSVETQTYVPEAVRFPPEAMLADIYRATGTWLEPPVAADGERTGERDGERVRERWAGGRLQERELVPVAGGRAVRIRASGTLVSGIPAQLEIVNERLGYRLQVTSTCAAGCPEPEAN